MSDDGTSWKRLFERAEAYDVELEAVRAALERRRTGSAEADDA